MALRLTADDPEFEAAFVSLLAAKRESSEEVGATVAAIIEDVRRRAVRS